MAVVAKAKASDQTDNILLARIKCSNSSSSSSSENPPQWTPCRERGRECSSRLTTTALRAVSPFLPVSPGLDGGDCLLKECAFAAAAAATLKTHSAAPLSATARVADYCSGRHSSAIITTTTTGSIVKMKKKK